MKIKILLQIQVANNNYKKKQIKRVNCNKKEKWKEKKGAK